MGGEGSHDFCKVSSIQSNNSLQQKLGLYHKHNILPRLTYVPTGRAEQIGFIQDISNLGKHPLLCHLLGHGAVKETQDYLQAAVKVTNTGVYNCDGARIPVASQLNQSNGFSILTYIKTNVCYSSWYTGSPWVGQLRVLIGIW